MITKTTPAPAGTGTEGIPKNIKSHSTKKYPLMPMRCIRIMEALISECSKTREEIDRIAPASNGPHYVGLIREKLELEIPCERVDFITKDGEPSWYGRYHTTTSERAVMREYLRTRGLPV